MWIHTLHDAMADPRGPVWAMPLKRPTKFLFCNGFWNKLADSSSRDNAKSRLASSGLWLPEPLTRSICPWTPLEALPSEPLLGSRSAITICPVNSDPRSVIGELPSISVFSFKGQNQIVFVGELHYRAKLPQNMTNSFQVIGNVAHSKDINSFQDLRSNLTL